jgi:hypothetical protein
VAAQDVFAVLEWLAQESVKIEAAATRVAMLCPALDSPGAEQMLGNVAKGAAPDEHHHCGIKEMGKSSHSCSVGGVDLEPDRDQTTQNCGKESYSTHSEYLLSKSLHQIRGVGSPFSES